MLPAMFRPIETPLTRPKNGWRASTFKGSWTNTLDTLERELRHLGAKDIIIQIDVGYESIRNDGWPLSTARPKSPGVILSFQSKHGALSYPCNTFSDWESNVRAIALALDALRRVDRYGVTANAEQYLGWRRLPGGEWNTAEDAARYLLQQGSSTMSAAEVLQHPEHLKVVYREAAVRAHPDNGSGTQEWMAKINRARDFIERSLKPA